MNIIEKYFPELTKQQREQFGALQELYTHWNSQINVISRQDMENLYVKHVLHSLGIAKVINFKAGTEILDVGTGGGFPGIPLAIMFPLCDFHLVDSIGKKIKVVNEVSQALGLKNVKGQHERVENLDRDYDFIVSRAVTRIKPFYGWIKDKFTHNSFNTLKNGILYLKGGDLNGDLGDELKELGKKYRSYELSDYFEEEFFETKKVIYIPQ
ncbi:MAG: 16S rRNA (guanine(527)-N(7))-methyltransferase RsmG [Spirosomaceae bacterium]|jgi:16S rRNA (guanine527-N7)-methyltransferase|nr:16S rRNA (guanine(527)-N(7))-methyltransferase RsmG [Spirosomataceae bacterium]